MKTLFCLRSSPNPPIGGAPLRNWQNINAMAKYGPVALFTAFFSDIPERENPFGPWEHFEITDAVWGNAKNWRENLYNLRPWSHQDCDRYYRPAAAAKLKALLQSFQPDWVVIGEPWMYRYLSTIWAYTHNIIFDNHNVEANVSLYQDRLPRRPGIQGKIEARLRHQQILNLERMLCKTAKKVWVCSEVDRAGLTQIYGLPDSKVSVVANGIDIDRFESVRNSQLSLPQALTQVLGLNAGGAAPLTPASRPHTVLFAATFDYSANIEAAAWLIDEIYPHLHQQEPNLRLMLVGRAPTPQMRDAAEANPNLIIPGLVDDIRPYYAAADAIVVPLRHGSGTRLKLLEAFAACRPVVSTAKGAEGLAVAAGKHLLMAEEPEAIARDLLDLLNHPTKAHALQESAFELVRQHHSWAVSAGQIYQSLSSFMAHP